MLAVTRASEICIGILCAGVVLVGTDLGGARRRLAQQLAGISGEIAAGFAGALLSTGPWHPETLSVRRELVRRVIALDPVIDEALGEASDVRLRWPILKAAVDGLFAALAAWRIITLHLEQLPEDSVGVRLSSFTSVFRASCSWLRPNAGRRAGQSIPAESAYRSSPQRGRCWPYRPTRHRCGCSPTRRLGRWGVFRMCSTRSRCSSANLFQLFLADATAAGSTRPTGCRPS